MRTVAVTINKGGQGKTTLTRSLATAAVLAGTNVLILDMDTQKNSTSWGKRRSNQHQKPLPLVRFATELDLNEELERAKDAGCDFVQTLTRKRPRRAPSR
jgi:chromosome partitioning protein